MCGLNGVFGVINHKEKVAFSILSLLSQLRGKDSTGVALISNNKKVEPEIAKELGGLESLVFYNGGLFEDRSWVLKPTNLKCIIGHNRWATIGDVNEENAHPFWHKDIIGCHNGTINFGRHHLDNCNYKETDSENIIKDLGDNRAVQETIKYLQGAWALVWFDLKKNELHMCRNSERDLFVAFSEDERSLFWASESWMLSIALSRADIKFQKPLEVKVNKHLVWGITKKGKVILRETEDAVGGYIKPWNPVAPIAEWFKRDTPNNVVPLKQEKEYGYAEQYTKGYGGSFIHRRRFEALTKDGCAYCTGDLTWEMRDRVEWFDHETPLCTDCNQHMHDNERKVN